MTPDSSSEFDHFLQAQNPVYDQVVEELTCGQKRSHWMWFVFPQVRGLGHSAMAQRFAIGNLDQARKVESFRKSWGTRTISSFAHQ
jgi:uncharacterized protein (DUF1810 family)